jgi:hypothetical protein
VYFNAARVPRLIDRNGLRLRNFSLIQLDDRQVTQIDLIWVDAEAQIHETESMYQGKGILNELSPQPLSQAGRGTLDL